MTAITNAHLDCYIPYMAALSGTTGVKFTAKVITPQYRSLWYDTVSSKFRLAAFYQGKTASAITFVSASPFQTTSDTSVSDSSNTVGGTSATYTVNVTNGVWLDPPNWWTY